jgi:hypothetical protein
MPFIVTASGTWPCGHWPSRPGRWIKMHRHRSYLLYAWAWYSVVAGLCVIIRAFHTVGCLGRAWGMATGVT